MQKPDVEIHQRNYFPKWSVSIIGWKSPESPTGSYGRFNTKREAQKDARELKASPEYRLALAQWEIAQAAPKPVKPLIVITMDGGNVQDVSCYGAPAPADVVLVDYDTEGADENSPAFILTQAGPGRRLATAYLTNQLPAGTPASVEDKTSADLRLWLATGSTKSGKPKHD